MGWEIMNKKKDKFFIISSAVLIFSLFAFFAALISRYKIPFESTGTSIKGLTLVPRDSEALNIEFAGKSIPSFFMRFLNTGKPFQFPDSLSSNFAILILFTPFDCSSCLTEIPFWNALTKYKEKFNVIGVISYGNSHDARKFIVGNDIKIPVLFDSAGIFFEKLPFPTFGNTPLKVLINKNGKILDLRTTTYNKNILQQNYLHDIFEVLNN